MQEFVRIRTALTNDNQQVLTISRSVYKALHPLDQLIARALEKTGKVRIVDQDD